MFNQRGAYPESVSLLKQIEVATGMSADKDILEGTQTILKNFAQRYGRDELNIIMSASNYAAIMRGSPFSSQDKILARFQEAQDILLETVFEKDYPQNVTLTYAKEYLEHMKEMELVRGRIEDDSFFKDYYNSKYADLKEDLLQQGYSQSLIEQTISQYTPAQFYRIVEKDSERFVYPPKIIAEWLEQAGIGEITATDELKKYHCFKDGIIYEALTINGTVIEYNEFPPQRGFKTKASLFFTEATGKKEPIYGEIYEIGKDEYMTARIFKTTSEGQLKVIDENGKSIVEMTPQEIITRKEESELNDWQKKIIEKTYGYSIPELNNHLSEANQKLLQQVNQKLQEHQKGKEEPISESKQEKDGIGQLSELARTSSFSKIKAMRTRLSERIKEWIKSKTNPQKEDLGKDNIPDGR